MHHPGLRPLFLVGTLAMASGTVHADEFHFPGSMCQSAIGSQASDINRRFIHVSNISTQPRQIICGIPRPHSYVTFLIHGSNSDLSSTTCTLTAYRGDGIGTGSVDFTESAPTNGVRPWEHRIFIGGSGSNVVGSDYVFLVCTLPGNEQGVIRGISISP